MPAIVGLPRPFDAGLYPEALAGLYRGFGFVDWTQLMFAGKLDAPDLDAATGTTLAYFRYAGDAVAPTSARVIGGSLCGDMMFCTADDRAGWWDHETGRVQLTGTGGELIDWVFGELLAGRVPERPGG